MPIYPNYQNYNYQQQSQTGFVTVRTEDDARNYPVAPGNSITFMSENAPFVYTKTMGFNQLDRPVFKKYRLVEENSAQIQAETEKATNTSSEDLKAEYEQIWSEIEQIKKDIKSMRNHRPRKNTKSEGIKDE